MAARKVTKKVVKRKSKKKLSPGAVLLAEVGKIIKKIDTALEELTAAMYDFNHATGGNGDAETDPESDTDSGWGAGVR